MATLVALLAMVVALENGYQAAFMAPTEILAEQHFLTFRRLLARCSYETRLLTSAVRGRERKEALGQIARGEARIVVGTHALIQQGVEFSRLGLAVVVLPVLAARAKAEQDAYGDLTDQGIDDADFEEIP